MQRTFIYSTYEFEKSVMIYRILSKIPSARIKSKIFHGINLNTDIYSDNSNFDLLSRRCQRNEFEVYPNEAFGCKLKFWYVVVIEGLPEDFDEKALIV